MPRWRTSGEGWECRADGHWMWTERLVLRPLTVDDTEAMLAAYDLEVVWWQGYPARPDQLREMVEQWTRNLPPQTARGAPLHWAVCDRATGELVGVRTLTPYMKVLQGQGCETGSSLKDGWRNKGYGTEELTAVVGLVVGHLGYSVILAGTNPQNARALRQYAKCGFELNGVRKGWVLPDGRTLDATRMRLVRPATRSCPYAVREPWTRRPLW